MSCMLVAVADALTGTVNTILIVMIANNVDLILCLLISLQVLGRTFNCLIRGGVRKTLCTLQKGGMEAP